MNIISLGWTPSLPTELSPWGQADKQAETILETSGPPQEPVTECVVGGAKLAEVC